MLVLLRLGGLYSLAAGACSRAASSRNKAFGSDGSGRKGEAWRLLWFVRNATCRKRSASATATAAIATGRTTYACAPMASITARIAARPAKSPLPNPMSNEPVRVVFHLNQDSRLIGILCGAVRFQASQAGLEDEAASQLVKAAEHLCHERISQLSDKEEGIDVTLETYADRVEVAVHSRTEAGPAMGLEQFAFGEAGEGRASKPKGVEVLSRVDRVLYNSENGVARTTLVKYLHPSR
jgi:hypothetical protein